MSTRDRAAARDFVTRDWSAATRDADDYWREIHRRHGPAEVIRIADELRRQVLAVRPDWPSAEEREEDLATHLRVIDVMRRVPPRAR